MEKHSNFNNDYNDIIKNLFLHGNCNICNPLKYSHRKNITLHEIRMKIFVVPL
jgi:hypothetical protein